LQDVSSNGLVFKLPGTPHETGKRIVSGFVRLSDGIGIVQPLALAVATGGGGGGDYGITQGGKISVRL
jgi:hypothetical protein